MDDTTSFNVSSEANNLFGVNAYTLSDGAKGTRLQITPQWVTDKGDSSTDPAPTSPPQEKYLGEALVTVEILETTVKLRVSIVAE